MKKVLHIIIIAFCIMTVSSCSKDESEKRIEFAKIVESRTSQDLLNDLYVGSDADIEAIARIMNVTPSSIERIRNGETEPTAQFEERIREVSLYYMQNDQSFSKLQSMLTLNMDGMILSSISLPTTHGGFGLAMPY